MLSRKCKYYSIWIINGRRIRYGKFTCEYWMSFCISTQKVHISLWIGSLWEYHRDGEMSDRSVWPYNVVGESTIFKCVFHRVLRTFIQVDRLYCIVHDFIFWNRMFTWPFIIWNLCFKFLLNIFIFTRHYIIIFFTLLHKINISHTPFQHRTICWSIVLTAVLKVSILTGTYNRAIAIKL
jgi:hypothetical protein